MNVLFFGLGFSSTVAADEMKKSGVYERIGGTVRTAEKAKRLRKQGLEALVYDGTAPVAKVSQAVRGASHVVFSIAPGAGGDPALNHYRDDLDAAKGLGWLCYYSTVGVYGDFGGAWINEDAPLVPRNERSDRRVAAEQAWRDFARARGVPLTILRLAGIYGPGRSTFDKLADGTAKRIVKPGQVFNRIHVADIARITALAAEHKLDGTYNLADDFPAPPQEIVRFAAELLGTDPPPEIAFETAQMTEMQRSFYADNKRVSNAAIKQVLGINLLFPDYRSGLKNIFATLP